MATALERKREELAKLQKEIVKLEKADSVKEKVKALIEKEGFTFEELYGKQATAKKPVSKSQKVTLSINGKEFEVSAGRGPLGEAKDEAIKVNKKWANATKADIIDHFQKK